jgi:hypothetical protein
MVRVLHAKPEELFHTIRIQVYEHVFAEARHKIKGDSGAPIDESFPIIESESLATRISTADLHGSTSGERIYINRSVELCGLVLVEDAPVRDKITLDTL